MTWSRAGSDPGSSDSPVRRTRSSRGGSGARLAGIGLGCVTLGRVALGCAGRLGRRLLGLGGALVRVAAIVGLVEPRALEEDGRTGADLAAQLGGVALGAVGLGLRDDRLVRFEFIPAAVAHIIVGWHRSLPTNTQFSLHCGR